MACLQSAVLQAATDINARTFHLENLGQVRKGYLADLIAVPGDPTEDIRAMRVVPFVMLNGEVVKKEF